MQSNNNLKKMSAGDVLDYSVQLFKRHFKKIALVTLVLDIPLIFIYNLVSTGLVERITGMVEESVYYEADPSQLIAYYLILLGSFAVYGIYAVTLKPIADAAITRLVYFDVVHGEQLPLKSTVKYCFKRFPSLFASKLLYYLILAGISLGLYIVVIILVIASALPIGLGFAGIAEEGASTAGVVLFIVYMLFILVVLALFGLILSYFMGKYRMNIPAIIIEDKGAAEAIGRCGQLSKKAFKYITLTYAFATLLIAAVMGILPLASQAALEYFPILYLISTVAIQLLQTFLTPYLTVVTAMMFIDLKVKREALDLELQIDGLLDTQVQEAGVAYEKE